MNAKVLQGLNDENCLIFESLPRLEEKVEEQESFSRIEQKFQKHKTKHFTRIGRESFTMIETKTFSRIERETFSRTELESF